MEEGKGFLRDLSEQATQYHRFPSSDPRTTGCEWREGVSAFFSPGERTHDLSFDTEVKVGDEGMVVGDQWYANTFDRLAASKQPAWTSVEWELQLRKGPDKMILRLFARVTTTSRLRDETGTDLVARWPS